MESFRKDMSVRTIYYALRDASADRFWSGSNVHGLTGNLNVACGHQISIKYHPSKKRSSGQVFAVLLIFLHVKHEAVCVTLYVTLMLVALCFTTAGSLSLPIHGLCLLRNLGRYKKDVQASLQHGRYFCTLFFSMSFLGLHCWCHLPFLCCAISPQITLFLLLLHSFGRRHNHADTLWQWRSAKPLSTITLAVCCLVVCW